VTVVFSIGELIHVIDNNIDLVVVSVTDQILFSDGILLLKGEVVE
jgi:hypothetical protein